MRLSKITHKPNEFVMSFHLGKAGLEKLKELQQATGMSRSAIVRTLLLAAKVNKVATLAAAQEKTIATTPD